MNVLSYINGDQQITDFPAGSARPLSILVQASNDLLAGPDGYLSPEHSVLALELAWQTTGTADVPDGVVHAWLAELLTDPGWGVIGYAKITAITAITDIAGLHRAAASGDMPASSDWDAAERAARRLAAPLDGAGLYALRAACQSTTLDSRRRVTLDEVTAYAVRAHALAAGGAAAGRIVEVTRRAISRWRELAGLSDGVAEPADVIPQADAAALVRPAA